MRQLSAARLTDPGLPEARRGGVGQLANVLAVIGVVRNEVLDDQLLNVTVARIHFGQSVKRSKAILVRLTDADEDAARERNLQLAGPFD